jgi:cell division protein FtsA
MAIFRSSRRDTRPIGVLDIGTSKVCCIIAGVEDGATVLLGLGHQRSRGMKSGMVIDADEAERAVRAAVGQAERMAGVSLDRIVVSLGCGRLKSTTFRARGQVETGVVGEHDIDRLLAGGEAYLDRSGRSVIQLMRSDWQLDSASDIPDPRGLAGRDLAVDLTAVTADDGPVRNLLSVMERGHLSADRLVCAPYASALAVMTDEERRLGAIVVDLGAGLTSFAAFCDGRLLHVDTVPVGGNHLTYDIARELVAPVPEAERIKTLYGTLVKAASNESEIFAYALAGDDDAATHQTSKAHVREIVVPRIDGLLELVAERISEAGLGDLASRRMILTGGASQLVGLLDIWASRFGGMVRIGRPVPVGRMPSSMCSPAFATALGLVGLVTSPGAEVMGVRNRSASLRERGYVDRVQRWIRESF